MIEAKLNYKNKPEYKKEKYLCDSCEAAQDENIHVIYCESYKDLHQGKDLNSDKDLAQYLQKVLAIRAKLRVTR